MRAIQARPSRVIRPRRPQLNRRAFLRGSAGVAIGLPFLESVPQRSAWAQGQEPRFALFIGTANGVVQSRFWPKEAGTLTDLSTDDNAAGALAGFEQWVSFLQGFKYPRTPTSETHAQSYPQTFTGAPYEGESLEATSTAASIDVILAPYLNADGREPLALYVGSKNYIGDCLSYAAAGQVRTAQNNPFEVYSDLLQDLDDLDVEVDARLEEALARRASAIDFVREDLETLLGQSGLGAADRARLELHLNSLRELERGLSEPAMVEGTCSEQSLDVEAITASVDNYWAAERREEVAALQLQLCAFAFACNLNHVATLQHGDGLDQGQYDVPSNDRGWHFHHISHRVESDSAVGDDPLAEAAHAEIDRLRLETFRGGLERFEQHGLLEHSVIMWANQFADGPSGSIHNLPIILAGNAGGTLRTGLHLPPRPIASERLNGNLLTTLAQALGVDETIGVTEEGRVDELLV